MRTFLRGLVRKTLFSDEVVQPRLASIYEPIPGYVSMPAMSETLENNPQTSPTAQSHVEVDRASMGIDFQSKQVNKPQQSPRSVHPTPEQQSADIQPLPEYSSKPVAKPHRGLLIPLHSGQTADKGTAQSWNRKGETVETRKSVSPARETISESGVVASGRRAGNLRNSKKIVAQADQRLQPVCRPGLLYSSQGQVRTESGDRNTAHLPSVSVTIGRIDVKAVPVSSHPKRIAKPEGARPMSLSEYLRRRSEDRGR